MEAYQQRVIEEKEELSKKITALTGFLFSEKSNAISTTERNMLRSQLDVMMQYDHCLFLRIQFFAGRVAQINRG